MLIKHVESQMQLGDALNNRQKYTGFADPEVSDIITALRKGVHCHKSDIFLGGKLFKLTLMEQLKPLDISPNLNRNSKIMQLQK